MSILVLLLPGGWAEAETLRVDAAQGEQAYPIWIRAGDTVTFSVSGTWSMWHPNWPAVDLRGHVGFQRINDHHLGALLGRIGDAQPQPIFDGLSCTSMRSGRLLLYPNRAGYLHYAPSGSLWVAVRGAEPVSHDEAERRHGWDIRKLDTGRAASYLSELEKDVLLYLNKARHDPPLFAELYLYPVRETSAAAADALPIVLALLIDDGVPCRGHRKNILWKEARCAGVAFREHATMRHICVQDFASAVAEKE